MDYLSLYEREQKHAIAAWKSERPSLLQSVASLWSPLTLRVTRVVDRALIERAVDNFDTLAARSSALAEVAALARVSNIDQLRYSPLNECDRLAARLETRMHGIDRSSADRRHNAPPILVSALRLICRIGHCYGYQLGDTHDRLVVMNILDYANHPKLEPQNSRPKLTAFAQPALPGKSPTNHDPAGSTIRLAPSSERHAPNLPGRKFVLDYGFLNRTAESARRVFQEQWLIENGKSDPIAPASRQRRSSLNDFSRAMGHAAYVVGGAIGFGAVFPVVALSRILTRGDQPVARGARDGARAATRHADQLISGVIGDDRSDTKAITVPTLRIMLG